MSRLILVGFFCVLLSMARADITLVNEIKSEGQTQVMVMKLKGKDALVKMNEHMSVLMNGATGDSIVLMHDQKKSMKIPGANLKSMLAQMTPQVPGEKPGAEIPKLNPNGKSETINGFKTEGYTYKQGATEVEYFLAKDFPELSDTLGQFQESGVNSLAGAAVALDVKTLPGFPVRTVVQSGGKTIVSTVKSVDRAKLPPDTFQMPAGYETMNLSLPQ